MTPPAGAIGRQLLAEWANTQDGWVRVVVGEVLDTRAVLTSSATERAYELLLAEKELSSSRPATVAALVVGGATEEVPDDLRLLKIRDVIGVNALAAGQEIALNRRLTVLFGENGTGKTGYVRVLKRVASVRSAEPILANVRAAAPAATPGAQLEYALNGVHTSVSWSNESGVAPFTRISVFDARAVSIHADDDLTYLFTPGDLAVSSRLSG